MYALLAALTALAGGAACRQAPQDPPVLPAWMESAAKVSDRPAPPRERPSERDTRPPEVAVLSPRAGATVTPDQGRVRLELSVTDAQSGVASLQVAGRPVDVPRGARAALANVDVDVRPGLATVPIDVVDVAGNRRRVLHPLVTADAWMAPNAPLPTEAAVQVTQAGLGRDALGRLVEEAMADFSVADHLPTPLVETLGHAVSLEDLTHARPRVTLTPLSGGARVRMRIPAFAADVVLRGPLEARARIWADAIVAELSVFAGIAGGRPIALPGRVVVSLEGLDVGLPRTLPSLTRTIRGAIERQLSARLRDEVHYALPDAVDEVAAALRGHQRAAVALPLGGAAPVEVAFDIRPAFATLARTGLSASVVTTVRGPDSQRSIPRLDGCGTPGHLSAEGPLTVAVPFEVVNALSHAFHAGGGWDVEIPASAARPAVEPVDVDVRLPPVVTGCGAPDGAVLVQFAGLRVRTVLQFAKLRLPIDAEVAFDIVVRVRATPEGQVELAPELASGSLVSTSTLVESFAPALATHLIPFRLPPDSGPAAFGLDFHIRRVAVDHAGVVLEGSAR